MTNLNAATVYPQVVTGRKHREQWSTVLGHRVCLTSVMYISWTCNFITRGSEFLCSRIILIIALHCIPNILIILQLNENWRQNAAMQSAAITVHASIALFYAAVQVSIHGLRYFLIQFLAFQVTINSILLWQVLQSSHTVITVKCGNTINAMQC